MNQIFKKKIKAPMSLSARGANIIYYFIIFWQKQ